MSEVPLQVSAPCTCCCHFVIHHSKRARHLEESGGSFVESIHVSFVESIRAFVREVNVSPCTRFPDDRVGLV